MSRSLMKTVEVKTDQGTIFTHLEYDASMNVTGVWCSLQQKKRDTQIEQLVHAIIDAVHDSIAEVADAKVQIDG